MNAAGQTICLVMIVKNEAPVIRRCLDSVRAIIDHWVIVDTGSSDGTQDLVRGHLDDVPGTLYERPWVDFAHNRSEALALARSEADYSLVIDADDLLQLPDGFAVPELTADCYVVDIDDPPLRYQRTQLVRNTQPWRYQGVLHEYLTCEGAGPPGHFPVVMQRRHDGARRRDPATYRRDAAVLEAALQTETDPFLISRYRFYLAQSYRDCGERENALANYLARAELGGWEQEVYIALYFAAQLKEALGHPEQEVIDTYLRASDLVASRVEALHGASRFCRYKSRNEEGYQIARRGIDVALPEGALFVEPWIYETGLLDEYSVNAYWSGHYREALDSSLKLLATGKMTGGEMQRVVANARFSAERVTTEPHKPNLGSLGAEGFIEQHKLVPARNLHSRLDNPPRVLVAILAKQKEPSLPLYLECIEALDYPKSSIVLYIRTNNNTDRTEAILRDWVARVGRLYAGVEFDAEDVAERVEQFGVHEWNATRFSVLGRIRNVSMQRALQHECEFYFVCDVDNFIRPCTLRELVALNLPIVAPFLRAVSPGGFYSNYHAETDNRGYYLDCDQYQWILNRWVRGVIELPVVHCTYLVRADVLPRLNYADSTDRHEYVVFSDIARQADIPQYFDNRQIYGYITFDESGDQHMAGGIEQARRLLNVNAEEPQPLANAELPSGADTQAQIRKRFTEIYKTNEWTRGSGFGSLPANNATYIEYLQSFIQTHSIKSVVDFGCGDWQFSRDIDWQGASYVGIDLVPEVIENNRKEFGRAGVSFEIFESLDKIPTADLLVCKDVLQHLSNTLICEYLFVFKKKFKFLLITNDDMPDHLVNSDIADGGYRPIVLDRAPFSEIAPVVFTRTDTVGGWWHKLTCLIEGCRDADSSVTIPPLRFSTVNDDDFPAEEFLADHKIDIIGDLARLPDPAPLVFVAILAKQKEYSLPLYLECLERLDYPKTRMILYIRTNNNTDRTADLLRAWILRMRARYRLIISNFSDVQAPVQQYGRHEWNAMRFKVLSAIRQESLDLAVEQKCDFYFTADVDNFIRPETLRELVALRKPIVAPMLRAIVANSFNTNFFAGVDESGYYRQDPAELGLVYRKRPGVYEVPLVHMTYLIDCAVIPMLRYDDGSDRYEFVVFAASARQRGIAQYVDTRYRYGYITCDDDREHAQANFGSVLEDPAGEARALLFGSDPAAQPLVTAPGPPHEEKNSKTAEGLLPTTLALCISISGSPRRETFTSSARSVGLEFEFLDAITRTELMHGFRVKGCTLDLTNLGWVLNEQYDPRRARAPMSFSEIGCAYSHISCWQEGLRRNVDFLFVFEDDVSFTRALTDIVMPADGDILYVDNRMGRDARGHASPYGCGTAGYMLSRAGIRRCLEIFSILYMPVDIQLMIHQHSQIAHPHLLADFRRPVPDEVLLTSYVVETPYCFQPTDGASEIDLAVSTPIAKPAIVRTGGKLPPMHVINLDRSTARWKDFRARNFHLGAMNRFSAFDGATLDLDELRRTGKIEGEPAYKIGMLGCALSHVALWEKAATTGQAVTIFEDDAVAAHCFVPAAERILNELPEGWEFVSWGYILNPLFAWVELPVSKIRMEDYGPNRIQTEDDLRRFQEEPVLPTAVRLRHCFGLQCYSISPAGARAALDYFLPIKSRQIEFPEAAVSTRDCGPDVSLCGLYPRIKAYIAVPQLAIHYDGGLSPRKVLDGEMEEAA